MLIEQLWFKTGSRPVSSVSHSHHLSYVSRIGTYFPQGYGSAFFRSAAVSSPSRRRAARPSVQVQQFEKETDSQRLPAVVYISGTETSIFLPRLVVFTGTRFLRSAAADACIKFGSQEETAQMQLLFSVLACRPDAPARLSMEALAQLLCACHFSLAEKLLDSFTEYLAPGIARLDAGEVCALAPESCKWKPVNIGN